MKKISFLLIAIIAACHPKGVPIQTPIAEPTQPTSPQILFVQIKVAQNDSIYHAQIINKTQVAGILDRDTRGIQIADNQWLISFFDKNKKLLDQTTVLNPLHEHFEVADDKGQFKSVEVKKQEAEFFFRIAYNPNFSIIQVEQIQTNHQKIHLFSINF